MITNFLVILFSLFIWILLDILPTKEVSPFYRCGKQGCWEKKHGLPKSQSMGEQEPRNHIQVCVSDFFYYTTPTKGYLALTQKHLS